MDAEELKKRTKSFSLRAIQSTEALPHTKTSDVIGKQLLRSATSVGANYRSALRAQSRLDFISKISISIEEADETLHWLELLAEANFIPEHLLTPLMKEADELITILISTVKSTRRKTPQTAKGAAHGQKS